MSDLLNLYEQYLFEREGAKVIKGEHGFITYKIIKDQCLLLDMFVEKSKRRCGVFSELFSELMNISLGHKCAVMTARVFLVDPNHKTTLQVAMSVGAEIVEANNNCISLVLKLSEEA